ncbi:MAG: transcriptional regulator [Acidimicrobiales bacterium]|jgi:transcriptional regulator with XRE-family HTH domain|nr:transcriptional regulator [Acidimicrobiaceae bacterium]MDP6322818.1 transcriptional regulator [Acidimicrobiales bacterium]MDP6894404.1 transcriptional regulator [Acidimicrobiales bacterium]|tara:strand:+ start:41 stop:568 length:528 start_codon:yes stop_codon:yes gene_type:complete
MEKDLEDKDKAYRSFVGERIRSIRKQKRLSLQEVEARSEAEFKASVLGAYERAERDISVPRLQRLANFYNVPVDQLLPSEDLLNELDANFYSQSDVDTSERSIVIDLTKLSESKASEAAVIDRYLKIIQVKRQDFNGRVLTIRRDDLQALAAIIGTTVEDAPQRLVELNLLRDAI